VGDTIPGEWIVVLRPSSDPLAVSQGVIALHGGQVTHTYHTAIRGFAGRLPAQAVEALRRNPNVAYVEPNRWGGIVTTQTNPAWGLDRIDQNNLPLSNTYTYNTDGSGVTAYILDTGIRATHNEFGGRAAYIPNGDNGDFVNDGHGNAADCHGHGTHVGGTLGGSTYGVAKNVTLRAGRVVNCQGGGSVAMAIAGVDWVTNNGQKPAVVNMSLGYGNVQSLRDAVENSIAAGYSYSVAAGNGDFLGTPQNACFESPAGALNAMTVGATAINDSEASFSNYGACVDILAPGVNVLSAWYNSNSATATISGTSMATPHVAGVIALYLDANPNHSPTQVSNALRNNAIQNTINLHSRSSNNGTANRFLNMTFIGGGGPNPVPPSADQVFSCAGRLCSFDDESSDSDGRIVSWAWEFGDGTASTERSPNHTYASNGTYDVKLTVADDDGLTASRTVQASTNGSTNRSPQANMRFDCSGSSCNFKSISGDDDGSISAVLWDFGDGSTSTATNPSHNFGSAGTWGVTLRVTDNNGARNWQSIPVTTGTSNDAPFASFIFPANGLQVDLSDRTHDSDGSIVARKWEFGDGATASATNVSHTYSGPGIYDITLIVTDDDGAKHSRTRQIAVSGAPPSNQKPTANFSYSCTNLQCSFQDGSSDSDGIVVSRSWNFGDGSNSSATNPSHTFASAGTYNVTLTVVDDDGANDSLTRQVTVSTGGSNPVANFVFDCTGNVCSFRDTSTDADGTIVDWVWTFASGRTSRLPTPNHTFANNGSHTVQLTVTDNDGRTHSRSLTVTTNSSSNAKPDANLRYTHSGLSYSFKRLASDSDGSIASQTWYFGDGSTSNAANPSHSFPAPGTYLVTLEVRDNQGAINWQTVLVTANGDNNEAPFASFTFPHSGLTVNLTDFSKDADGTIASYRWEFGDGTSSTEANPPHTYSAAGTYLVTLRVIDNQGRPHSRTRSVIVP
jgi:PKD repeat protein